MNSEPLRSWVEISRRRIAANFQAVRATVGPAVEVMPVVKADAYRHGAAEVSRVLETEGAGWLAVHRSPAGGPAIRLQLLPESSYVHGDRGGVAVAVFPYLREELDRSHGPAGIERQVPENLEFPGGQRNPLRVSAHGVAVHVEEIGPEGHDPSLLCAGAAEQRLPA